MRGIRGVEIEGERILLKKNKYLGWGVINPYKINEKINWFNFLTGGNWYKFGIIIFVVMVILICLAEYANTLKIASDCLINKQLFIITP